MFRWPSGGEADLENLLMKARGNFKLFSEVICFIEDDHYSPKNYHEQYGEDDCRAYFRYLLDTLLLPTKNKIGGVTTKTMRDILLVGFGVHPNYPRQNYKGIQDRRIAYATDAGLIKRSEKPESIAHLLWRRENKGIAVLVSLIKEDLLKKEKCNGPLSYGDAVKRRQYTHYDLYTGEEDDEACADKNTVYNTETISFPEEYKKFTRGSFASYAKLNPSVLRIRLGRIVPYNKLDTTEKIAETINDLEQKVVDDLKMLLWTDPAFLSMLALGIADIPYDPFVVMPERLPFKESEKEATVPLIYQGQIMAAKYPPVKEIITILDWARGIVENSSEKWDFGPMAVWLKYIMFEGKLQYITTTDQYHDLCDAITNIINNMPFRGVVYARSSRNYRISPEALVKGEWCIMEEKEQITSDWLVFDYVNEEQVHAFSVGFRPEALRLAVFTPIPIPRIEF